MIPVIPKKASIGRLAGCFDHTNERFFVVLGHALLPMHEGLNMFFLFLQVASIGVL